MTAQEGFPSEHVTCFLLGECLSSTSLDGLGVES